MTTPSTQVYPKKTLRYATEGLKICTRGKCSHSGEPQLVSNFCRNKTERDGFHNACKDCVKEAAIVRKQRNLEIFKDPSIMYPEGKTKVCSRKNCPHGGIQQPLTNFYKHSVGGDGLNTECKDCSDAAAKKYRNANSEKVKESINKWQELNKDKMQEYQAMYWKKERQYRIDHWSETKIREIGERSKKRGIPFNLEVSDLLPLPQFCSVFGILLDYKSGTNRRSWASVDRIKPKLGYVKGNIRIISLAANMAKFDGDGDVIESYLTPQVGT